MACGPTEDGEAGQLVSGDCARQAFLDHDAREFAARVENRCASV